MSAAEPHASGLRRRSAIAALVVAAFLGAAPRSPGADDATTPSDAAPRTCHLDTARSTIAFHGHAFLHGFDGTARFLASDVALSASAGHGVIAVDATSMSTDNARRDRRMHAEVMDSPHFGTVTFQLLRLEASDGGLVAVGIWTMHGVARPLRLPITLSWSAAPQAHLSTDLDILDWDIVPPTLLGTSVSKTVHVEAALTFTPDPAAAPVPPPPGPNLPGASLLAPSSAPRAPPGLPHPLGRVLIIATPAQAQAAALEASRLAALAPADRRPLVVLAGEAATTPGAWLDPRRILARLLMLPARPLLIIALDDQWREQAMAEDRLADDDAARFVSLAGAATRP